MTGFLNGMPAKRTLKSGLPEDKFAIDLQCKCCMRLGGFEFDFDLRSVFSILVISNFFFSRANFFHACFPLRSFATSALLTIKFLPNHEGIIKPRSDQWCQWRSAVSRFWVLLRVSLCPLWFKRLLSALISENQRPKGFDLLRASAPWWVLFLFLGLVVARLRCVPSRLNFVFDLRSSAKICGEILVVARLTCDRLLSHLQSAPLRFSILAILAFLAIPT
jgi:hypothetical protein